MSSPAHARDAPARAEELLERAAEVGIADAHRLRGRITGTRKIRDEAKRAGVLARIATDVTAAETRTANRRAAVPTVRYPPELPVSRRVDDLAAAIRDNQVVVVAGETGSGKTTQLPKVCLELGRGVRGTIGHTQPRRLAARTVAERIAEELDVPLGDAVGWKVRFTDQAGEDTLVKLMTDGILLAEIQHDRLLRAYDTLIIDEAHERSLNIDFILGYLVTLLPKRPDLKVIITSATIDPQRFADYFGGAPIVEVSGRTYPVEVRYRPLTDSTDDTADTDPADEKDRTAAVCKAARELTAEGPGDILVFLSGEREIRDTQQALEALKLPSTEVLPLYARLSAAEQHKVFQRHSGRRIVLATNVAETSLTVPGIKYVIDPGTARISRYSHRTKVQRLPIEPISQASANQRKGRCGRTSDGICVRLYSEEDFEARQEFTDPEIQRTTLASVILQMTAAGLGEIETFGFIDPPEKRSIADGLALLEELGALEQSGKQRRLTDIGRALAQLPIDPRLARMVLAAGETDCAREVMIIAAALSIQDPRERPVDAQQQADAKHARFAEPKSDFLSYLNLWNHLKEQQKSLSGNQFRKQCRADYLNYLRVREWQDVAGQLRQLAAPLGITRNDSPAEPNTVHQAILAGLLSHLGMQDATDRREYLGARGAKFAIFPGSTLFKSNPRWVMAAELVETSRLWGRTLATVEPEWAEKQAAHLVKRNYSEPHWERKQGAVLAYEKVTLYGLPIVPRRKVQYSRIDPELCRELFIRHALVEGDWQTNHPFFARNRELLDEVAGLEDRARRRDILVDEHALFEFYDARVGAEVVSSRHFDSWWKKVRREQPELLDFERAMLVNESAAAVSDADYPDLWRQGELSFPLSYSFEPGTEADGVTVTVPLALLNRVRFEDFSWQVPGLRLELVTALIKSLPKQRRRLFAPAPDNAAAALARLSPGTGTLPDALARVLSGMSGLTVTAEEFEAVPEHLRMNVRVTDSDGSTLAESREPETLRARFRPRLTKRISEAAKGIERTGLSTWDFGALPKEHAETVDGYPVSAFPALVDETDSVAVRVFDSEADQRAAMWAGTRRMLLLGLPSPVRRIQRGMDNAARLALGATPYRGGVDAMLEDCVSAAVDAIMRAAGAPVWTDEEYQRLLDTARRDLPVSTERIVGWVRLVLAEYQQVRAKLGSIRNAMSESVVDVQTQLDGLVYDGFVSAVGAARLPDLVRYLQAARQRLDKLASNPARDVEWTHAIAEVVTEYRDLLAAVGNTAKVREIRWMIEELRVGYFANSVRTAYPVSEKRIYKAMDAI